MICLFHGNPYVKSNQFIQTDESTWDKIFDINVKAAYLIAQESLPLLRKRGGGSIVFVSSIAGFQPISVIFFMMNSKK